MVRVVLIMGGNRGDVKRLPIEAAELIAERVGRVVRSSRCYESAPWGFEAENSFWNQVLEVESELSPRELLDAIHEVEHKLGRDREKEGAEKMQSGQRYASRTMDIDILFYGDELIDSPELQVPHPRMAEREFVLKPLCELMPERRHPLCGRTMQQLWDELKNKSARQKGGKA